MASANSPKLLRTSFSKGMNYFVNPTELAEDEYPLLINGRSRFNQIDNVNAPARLNGLPNGGKGQGLYAAGNIAVAFVNGYAYYRNFSAAGSQFERVNDFNMNAGVDQIFMEIVPASTINYKRAQDTDASDASSPVRLLAGGVLPSPAAGIVQDGISQPWVILSNGTARITQNYKQWSDDYREYVPVGKQMLFKDGVLYTVSTDGLSLYRSVTGRPLDHMIVIDQDGAKLPEETEGGAATVSHSVSFDPITCIGNMNSPTGGFFVGTKYGGWEVSPDLTNGIYGEPVFSNRQFIAGTGPNNQQSFLADVNGDSCFADSKGVRSFNSIQQYRLEGKNSPFTLNVSALFQQASGKMLTQNTTACGQFDNYSLFAVNTIFGPAVLWYDDLRGVWDSIEIYPEITGNIIQFSTVKTDAEWFLLFRTSKGEFYEWGASSKALTTKMYVGELTAQNGNDQVKLQRIELVFTDIKSNGTVYATSYVDRKSGERLSRALTLNNTTESDEVVEPPYGHSSRKTTDTVTIDMNRSEQGWRVGLWLEWDFQAELQEVAFVMTTLNATVPMREQMQRGAATRAFFAGGA